MDPRRRNVLIVIAALLAGGVVAIALASGGDDDGAGPAPALTAPDGAPSDTAMAPAVPDGGEAEGHADGEAEGPASDAEPLDGTIPGADGELAVGLGDQTLDMFQDPRFRKLGVKHVRLVAPWDMALRERKELRAWIDAAKGAGADPFLALNHSRGQQCPKDPCSAPSVKRFERAFRAMRERFPDVTTFSTWNEPNHASQPVRDRPGLVASYYESMKRICTDCTIVAADVVGDSSAREFVRAFRRAIGGEPEIWGLHNYPDTNRFSFSGTRDFLGATKAPVWITETGGIVEFTTASGKQTFPYDEARAAKATRHMLRVARSSPRIDRLYVYQWRKTAPTDRFDAGLVNLDGSARPAYDVLQNAIR